MKTIVLILIGLTVTSVYGQDYYAVVKKNDDVTYNYPETAKFTLIDSYGNTTAIEKDDAIDVTGDYTLSIDVLWKSKPEIITSNGGRLEVFILPTNYKYFKHYKKTDFYERDGLKPTLETKEITQTKKDAPYNLLAVFSNGLTFKYSDGAARAWLNGEEVEVTNKYFVESPEGLLKLSFDPTDGEFWYVFDTKYNR